MKVAGAVKEADSGMAFFIPAPWRRWLSGVWAPLALGGGVAVALFTALVLVNRDTLAADEYPGGDQAADLLLIQNARSGWIGYGHYSFTGVNHPGPFFLYLRYGVSVLGRPFTGSDAGADLLGIYAIAALFSGLLAMLVQTVIRRRAGVRPWPAAAGAVLVLVLVLAVWQMAYAAVLAGQWMPYVLCMPFLAFLVAAVAASEGSAFGLLACGFCGAALFHGYIPLVPTVEVVCLAAAGMGEWSRRRAGAGGFPPWVWGGCGAIGALFALPLVADAVVNPPGNTVKILWAAVETRQNSSSNGIGAVLRLFWAEWRRTIWGIMLLVGLGAWWGWRRRDGGGLWIRTVVIGALAVAVAVLTLMAVTVPLRGYMIRFIIGVPVLLMVPALVEVVRWGAARHPRVLAVAPAAVLLAIAPAANLNSRWGSVPNTGLRPMAEAIVRAAGPVSRVEFETQGHILAVSGLFLALGRYGVFACHRDPARAYFFSPQRICRPSDPPAPAFRVARQPVCGGTVAPLPDGTDGAPVFIGRVNPRDHDCLRVERLP